MKCEDTKLLMMDFLYGEIDSGSEQVLRQHLEICSACRSEYEALQRTSLAMHAWQDETPPRDLVFIAGEESWLQSLKKVLFPEQAPLWGRLVFGMGVAAITALVVSAALNMELNYTEGNLSYRASLAPRLQAAPSEEMRSQLVEQLRSENEEVITRLVAAGLEKQRADMDRRLVNVAVELQRQYQDDLMLVSRGLQEVEQNTVNRLQQTDQVLDHIMRVANLPPKQ